MTEKTISEIRNETTRKIINLLEKIEDELLLNRIYRFVKYIYIHKT